MNRKIFMERLKELLRDLPTEEREEAVAYYESYFDEAGPENEQSVIEELESPEKVAKTIKADLFGNVESNPDTPAEPFINEEKEERRDSGNSGNRESKIALLIILAVATFPIWVSLAAVVFGLVMAVIGVLFGGIVGIVAGAGALFIAGFALIIAGFFSGEAAIGLLLAGIGMLILALGVLALLCMVWICVKIVPLVCGWIVELCRRLFRRKEERTI